MFDYYTLDGVNNTDTDFNTYVALPSLDGIQEFKVQTGVYSAEYGHEASQVNVLSKSGTNTYHGAVYEFIRNNYVDANPYFFPYNAAPPAVYPYKWNDYGFELDGPIRIPKIYDGRNKFFFMVDDEWRKIRTIGQGLATVPSRRPNCKAIFRVTPMLPEFRSSSMIPQPETPTDLEDSPFTTIQFLRAKSALSPRRC